MIVLTEVVDRLTVEFAGTISRDAVEVVVEDVAAGWRDAPIQAFIPLLAENVARRHLKGLDTAAGRFLVS
jgi:hypothetical protein